MGTIETAVHECIGRHSADRHSSPRSGHVLQVVAPTMRRELCIGALRRAAQVYDSEGALAARLGVRPRHLTLWMRGLAPLPARIFFEAVDVITDYDVSQLFQPDTRP